MKKNKCIIPTLYTFFQDIWYFEECANGIKQLVTLGKHAPTIKTVPVLAKFPGQTRPGTAAPDAVFGLDGTHTVLRNLGVGGRANKQLTSVRQYFTSFNETLKRQTETIETVRAEVQELKAEQQLLRAHNEELRKEIQALQAKLDAQPLNTPLNRSWADVAAGNPLPDPDRTIPRPRREPNCYVIRFRDTQSAETARNSTEWLEELGNNTKVVKPRFGIVVHRVPTEDFELEGNKKQGIEKIMSENDLHDKKFRVEDIAWLKKRDTPLGKSASMGVWLDSPEAAEWIINNGLLKTHAALEAGIRTRAKELLSWPHIFEMPSELVTRIASESEENRALREQLNKKLQVLANGLVTCRQFEGNRSVNSNDQDLSQTNMSQNRPSTDRGPLIGEGDGLKYDIDDSVISANPSTPTQYLYEEESGQPTELSPTKDVTAGFEFVSASETCAPRKESSKGT
ncbi:zinc knuckle domain protein [Aspergillus affinis]|uniref:zinc knuckle domain protein n=1 Tax=Aspergillus affinis TaxID=1070780 RepID=UPI0022FE74E8|nr:zinc knuckle domain protein [Aspergillus affinis]KAI9035009.1 zinc knuckle domain protein [Aspergillus affinis]